jgi:hypothetical protein
MNDRTQRRLAAEGGVLMGLPILIAISVFVRTAPPPPPRSADLRGRWPPGDTVAALLTLACRRSWTVVCKPRAKRSPLTAWP